MENFLNNKTSSAQTMATDPNPKITQNIHRSIDLLTKNINRNQLGSLELSLEERPLSNHNANQFPNQTTQTSNTKLWNIKKALWDRYTFSAAWKDPRDFSSYNNPFIISDLFSKLEKA